jgi:colicin import membrane protein
MSEWYKSTKEYTEKQEQAKRELEKRAEEKRKTQQKQKEIQESQQIPILIENQISELEEMVSEKILELQESLKVSLLEIEESVKLVKSGKTAIESEIKSAKQLKKLNEQNEFAKNFMAQVDSEIKAKNFEQYYTVRIRDGKIHFALLSKEDLKILSHAS